MATAICTVRCCRKRVCARGYCDMHRQRLRRTGRLELSGEVPADYKNFMDRVGRAMEDAAIRREVRA